MTFYYETRTDGFYYHGGDHKWWGPYAGLAQIRQSIRKRWNRAAYGFDLRAA